MRFVFILLYFSYAATAFSQASSNDWVTSWYAAPQKMWGGEFVLPNKHPGDLGEKTIRQRVKISLGGEAVSFTFSNKYGTEPVKIEKIAVALVPEKPSEQEEFHELRFSGSATLLLPPGEERVSDVLSLDIPSLSHIDVDMYFRDTPAIGNFHWDGLSTALIGEHDQVGHPDFESVGSTTIRLFLSEINVKNKENTGAIIALGDSITDGDSTTVDMDARWPDFLALKTVKENTAVVNSGISGARLLSNGMGESALARLDRDVFAQAGARELIVAIGINDIAWPGTELSPDESPMTLDRMKEGYRQIVLRAHQHGMTVAGTTLTPFQNALEGSIVHNYYTREKEALRLGLNTWIRESGVFDYVIDFDRAIQDRKNVKRIAPTYDSGDHLHPGDLGTRVMAEQVHDLE